MVKKGPGLFTAVLFILIGCSLVAGSGSVKEERNKKDIHYDQIKKGYSYVEHVEVEK